MKSVAIIGGGASGLMAACFAAERAKVTVFERQKMAGRKILATGNGRCNISNRGLDSSRYHGKNPSIVRNIFGRFGLDETEAFFESIGLPLVDGKDGKLFPASLQASSVQKLLVYEAQKRGADITLHRRVDAIIPETGGITLVTAGHERFMFDSVILAAGSCAYPGLGASNSGYELAASLGHTVHTPFPAIVPLNVPMKALHKLEGIKWDCRLRAMRGDTALSESTGELLFTKYGISGPAALEVSRAVNAEAVAGRQADIILDFFPDKDEREVSSLCALLWNDGERTAAFSLAGILKERMPEAILGAAGIDPFRLVRDLASREKNSIVAALKEFRIPTGKPRGFEEAVVAAGGVDTDEIDPATMESRRVKGLYITGELLDIDGDSGGFNLQFAWSTGAIAGMAM